MGAVVCLVGLQVDMFQEVCSMNYLYRLELNFVDVHSIRSLLIAPVCSS